MTFPLFAAFNDLTADEANGRIELRAVKTANETVNNSAVMQNDDSLFVAVEDVSTYWAYELFVILTSSTTADFKCDLSLPSGALHRSTLEKWSKAAVSGSNMATTTMFQDTDTVTMQTDGTTFNTQHHIVKVKGVIIMSTTTGNVQFRWAQNTATVADTIVYAGSWMKMLKLSE